MFQEVHVLLVDGGKVWLPIRKFKSMSANTMDIPRKLAGLLMLKSWLVFRCGLHIIDKAQKEQNLAHPKTKNILGKPLNISECYKKLNLV